MTICLEIETMLKQVIASRAGMEATENSTFSIMLSVSFYTQSTAPQRISQKQHLVMQDPHNAPPT